MKKLSKIAKCVMAWWDGSAEYAYLSKLESDIRYVDEIDAKAYIIKSKADKKLFEDAIDKIMAVFGGIEKKETGCVNYTIASIAMMIDESRNKFKVFEIDYCKKVGEFGVVKISTHYEIMRDAEAEEKYKALI